MLAYENSRLVSGHSKLRITQSIERPFVARNSTRKPSPNSSSKIGRGRRTKTTLLIVTDAAILRKDEQLERISRAGKLRHKPMTRMPRGFGQPSPSAGGPRLIVAWGRDQPL